MRNVFCCIVSLTLTVIVFGQSKFPASAISPALLAHADAVIRIQETVFEVKNKGEAISTEHTAVTILNENAKELGSPVFDYDEFREITNIEASVYDAEGTLVRNLKKKDIIDVKPPNEFIYDYRLKVLDLPSRPYPYTVEYSVEKEHKGLMFYPQFQPQSDNTISVEYAKFTLVKPAGMEVRFQEYNLPEGSKVGPTTWQLKDIAAFMPPPYSTWRSLGFAKVVAAPTEFSIAGYDGDMSTWESFGKFIYKLNVTQQDIPEVLKAQLKVLVGDCQDDYCKIEKVYEFLQSNTRYFYVGLGIGGWQPAPALKVDKYKYGDCKGLSNYMVSMLQSVDVPARYVLIKSGQSDFDAQVPDFPNPRFDHVIVCVPMPKDTVWLECTSQTESCGFLGNFTDNRMALMITPEGGKVLHTPIYDETKNTIKRTTQIKLKPDGSATLDSKDNYSCNKEGFPAYLESLHDEDRKKMLYKALDINNFEIAALAFTRHKGRFPSVEQQMTLSLPNYASVNGKRLFIPTSLLANKMEVPIANSDSPNYFRPDSRGFTEEDSIVIDLPIGFKLEAMPSVQNIATKFGSYFNEVTEQSGKLLIHRKLVLNGIQRPKEDFQDFIVFLKAIVKADKAKVVLVKESVGP